MRSRCHVENNLSKHLEIGAMTPDFEHEFKLALKEFGLTFSDSENDIDDALLPCGHYRIIDNPNLTQQLCDIVAERTGAFWTFTEYLRLQNTTPEVPIEPQLEDEAFDPVKIKYDNASDRKVARIYRYQKAYAQYEEKHKSYQRLLLQIRAIRAAGKFDVGGYLDFVVSTLQDNWAEFSQNFFFTPKTFYINEKARQSHTFITGGTGAGKSEAIKTLIRHYLTKNTKPALVVLDPHGDLALDVAGFKENATNDRLVYVSPSHFKGKHISFNPFDIQRTDEISLNRAQVQFLGALEQIIGETLTRPQRALLTPCIGVLLHRKNSNFTELVRFMDDKRNRDLVQYGQNYLPNAQDKDFFQHQFNSRNFESTKEALRYRFGEIIRDPTVREFLCNPSTFNLSECLEAGKLIVFHFNPDYHTQEAIRTTGQLINAFITNYAMSRPKTKRRPIHLFADECQYFVSSKIEEILGESRKFGLYLTLATQRTEQVGSALLDAIFGNVGCYLIGRNKNKTAKKMAEEHPISADDIRELKKLEFFQIQSERQAIKTKIRIVGNKHALAKTQWETLKATQSQIYYRDDKEIKDKPNSKHAEPVRKPKFPIPDVSAS